ncbi:hypothetical protein TanjilG_05193 [Lupinus angustifolius]|uniref:Membrane-associated kinase regulator n=1 Tax=Lupinus angustifolius TaxID=3871 RepID=A0A4P1RAQ7_LUPAN|nr:hypothetical protein TanjilG_05193 [Lupinus angustifolius]
MAVELCSENCGVVSMSPRISFSHGFSQSDVIPVEIQHPLRSNSSGLNSSIDFDFCVQGTLELESSSADELFSDGVILPIEMKKKKQNIVPENQTAKKCPQPICENASTNKNFKKDTNPTKETKDFNDDVDEKHISKSFWRFKRSSSCGSGYGRSLCPLPLLSRSNSTGSTSPTVKRMPLSKEGSNNIKQSSHKHSSTTTRSNSQSFVPNNHQKPPLKRTHHRNNGTNSMRVSPVLNVPPANLFGFASIFSNNRGKSKKK